MNNLAIQVAYSLDGDAREREAGNLRRLAGENPGTRLLILTHSEEETIEDGETLRFLHEAFEKAAGIRYY